MDQARVEDLLYQALETEMGGQKVYKAAIKCAANDDLREEWQKYLEETEEHERILRTTFETLSLDPSKDTPGRQILRDKAAALVASMDAALKTGGKPTAQLVAAECVVEAETKDHQNWELIGRIAEETKDKALAKALQEAYEQVEEQEDEHLYHTMGWCRELWIEALGMPAVLPPPEEEKSVKTAIGAARASQQREDML
jgi:rubrerythrin